MFPHTWKIYNLREEWSGASRDMMKHTRDVRCDGAQARADHSTPRYISRTSTHSSYTKSVIPIRDVWCDRARAGAGLDTPCRYIYLVCLHTLITQRMWNLPEIWSVTGPGQECGPNTPYRYISGMTHTLLAQGVCNVQEIWGATWPRKERATCHFIICCSL